MPYSFDPLVSFIQSGGTRPNCRAVAAGRRSSTVADKRAEIWRMENAQVIKSFNAYVEKHGLPLEKYRMF